MILSFLLVWVKRKRNYAFRNHCWIWNSVLVGNLVFFGIVWRRKQYLGRKILRPDSDILLLNCTCPCEIHCVPLCGTKMISEWIPANILNSRLWQVAVWDQLRIAPTTTNWRGFSLNSPNPTIFHIHLWKHFSPSPAHWEIPKHTYIPAYREQEQIFLLGKTCIPQELFQSRCSFSVYNNPCRVAEGEALFITTDSRSDRGENLFCFRHPLPQSTHSSDYVKLCFHPISKSSLNVAFLLNGWVSILITQAFE